jgi:hypothetical protein
VLLAASNDYRLSIATTTLDATLDGSGAVTGTTSTSDVRYAFFRTSGPPTDLSPYVASHGPDLASGLVQYGAYDLSLAFDEGYVKSMYGGSLSLVVVDENGATAASSDGGGACTWTTRWTAQSAALAYVTTAWLGALSDAGISTSAATASATGDDALYATVGAGQSLPGGRRLEARVSYGGAVVYSFPLLTSRFADFSALVAALSSTVYTQTLASGVPTAAQSATLQSLAKARAAAGLAFSAGEGADFESVYYDVFGLAARSLPSVPELTVVKTAAGAIEALLLELPEPLDWDRVSLAIAHGGAAISFGALRSVDRARAFLLRPGGASATAPRAWAAGDYTLTFTYALDLHDGTHPTLYRRGSSKTETPAALTRPIG